MGTILKFVLFSRMAHAPQDLISLFCVQRTALGIVTANLQIIEITEFYLPGDFIPTAIPSDTHI